jgi:hypothetical protein
MFSRVIVAALAGILLLNSMPAQALTITQTQGFIGQPNFLKTVEFAEFDPAHGQLQSVEVRMSLIIDGGSLIVDNDRQEATDVDVKLGATSSIFSTDVHLIDSNLDPILSGASTLSVATGSRLQLAGDSGSTTFDPALPDTDQHLGGHAATTGIGLVSPNYLSEFLGTDMFELRVDVDQLIDYGAAGGTSGQFDPVLAETNVTLIYEFSELVPEPSTALTALIGAWMVLGSTRRRKS